MCNVILREHSVRLICGNYAGNNVLGSFLLFRLNSCSFSAAKRRGNAARRLALLCFLGSHDPSFHWNARFEYVHDRLIIKYMSIGDDISGADILTPYALAYSLSHLYSDLLTHAHTLTRHTEGYIFCRIQKRHTNKFIP